MGRRTVLLIVAVVIAAIGAALIFVYAHNANDRAVADQNPVQVLVATKLIQAGESGAVAQQSASFDRVEVAKKLVPGEGTVIDDPSAILNLVALSPIYPGELILANKFGQAASASDLPIPAGMLAISIQLGDPERVAGFVQPGSNVAVFATLNGPVGNSRVTEATRVVLPKARVIAVGQTAVTVPNQSTSSQNTEDLPKTLLTLAVTQREAQKVIFAQSVGDLYFGLLTPTSHVTKAPAVSITSLFR